MKLRSLFETSMIELDMKLNKLYAFYDTVETSNGICEPQILTKPRGFMVSTPRINPLVLTKTNRLFLHTPYHPFDISRR